MAERGRRTKLTPEVTDRLVQALALGNYRQDAADFAGIDVATLRRWMARGRAASEGLYAELYEAVRAAEARAKITATGCITKAARDGEWRAAAWWLQRKFPHQFSEQSQLFLVRKAFEQIEAAAEAAGQPLSESVWDSAWQKLASDYAKNVPGLSGMAGALGETGSDELLEQFDLDEDERRVLLKVVRGAKRGQPEQTLCFYIPRGDQR